jgi:hypothetical protein
VLSFFPVSARRTPALVAAAVVAVAAQAAGPATTPIRPGPEDLLVSPGTARAEGRRLFGTLRSALAAARPGRRILVAAGIYRENELPLVPGVALYGGFDPSFRQRDIVRYATVIDGGGRGRLFQCAEGAIVDGFRLQGGAARGPGGAILCDGLSPELSNNVWQGNRTLAPAGWKPRYLHEDAHDGGAVACLNGCRALIRANLFRGNRTEIGRGGALAAVRAAPRILENVFFDNEAGLKDPMRSSDGGAVSLYDRSHAEFAGNVVLSNRALNRNDAGGLFVALWSAPRIAGNVFAGNYGDDDGGALFVGGQKHHYETPLDPLPPAEVFTVRIEGNLFAGNRNSSGNSGAFRITMESRAVLARNLTVENEGVYFQRSEIRALGNVFLDDVRVTETKAGLGGYLFRGNRFGKGFSSDVPVAEEASVHRPAGPEEPELAAVAVFLESARRAPELGMTIVELREAFRTEWRLRVLQCGDRWAVMESGEGRRARLWGELGGGHSLRILPAAPAAPGGGIGER